jgi:mannose-6-phosphate isomerase
MSRAALVRRAREAQDWMVGACFPLWASRGLEPSGLFSEVLTLDGDPAPRDTTRVRVQARQTYVFAEAARMGWSPEVAIDLVQSGVATLSGAARRGDGLIGRTLASDGSGLTDDTADLYDNAFALFALAEAQSVLPDAAHARDTARSILSAIDTHLADSAHGGYAETLPRQDAARLQNPHMHLFEACLALHRVDPDGGHLERASGILPLFLNRFTSGPGGLLGERFAPDWSLPSGRDADIVEPGHQFEWVWLLHTYGVAAASPLPPEARQLYTFATGTLDAEGRACQEVSRAGDVIDGSRRTWVQTEALKAHLAMYEATRDEAFTAGAAASFDSLMDDYLTDAGGWIDHFDAGGGPIAGDMPASTGYHVVLAFAELIRVANG